jgi:hypothetical protein
MTGRLQIGIDGRLHRNTHVWSKSLGLCVFVRLQLGECGFLQPLINTAKLNGLDPQTWLADVLERIVSGKITINQLDVLLPWNWRMDADAARRAA